MRIHSACWGMLLLLLVTGCNGSNFNIISRLRKDNRPVATGTITSEQLVKYLNRNAELLQTVRCDEVEIRAALGLGILRNANMNAIMVCEQPRNFRMRAKAATGFVEVDVGSNAQEFWFFIPKAQKAQIYCSYADLESGKVQHIPFPFQPEWVMETLLMCRFGPAEKYQLKETSDELRLIEKTKSPQGKTLRKVIVFNRHKADVKGRGEPQIKAFLLLDDATGKEICSARIRSAQCVSVPQAKFSPLLPKQMELRWPEQDITLTMTFHNPRADVQLTASDRNTYFARQTMGDIPSVDLAQVGTRAAPTSLQRVRGYTQRR